MTIESNRALGGVAACLTATGVVSQVISIFMFGFGGGIPSTFALAGTSLLFGFLGLIGFILYLVAMHGLARDYGENNIFGHIMAGLIIAIILGIIVFFFGGLTILFAALGGSFGSSSSTTQSTYVLNALRIFLPLGAVVGFVWVFFNFRALRLLGDKSKVPLFQTGAKVLLAGAAVSIAVTVIIAATGWLVSYPYNNALLTYGLPGGIIQNAAWVLLAMSYFRIQAPTATAAAAPANIPPLPTVYGQAKTCPRCGTQNFADAQFCSNCGQKL